MWIFGFPDLLKFYSALRELETVWKNSTDMKLYDICVVQICKNMWFNVKLKFERSRNDKLRIINGHVPLDQVFWFYSI